MSGYRYSSLQHLDEIRLLRLEPASDYNDNSVGSLIHVSLTCNTPNYEALSYVWEDSSYPWTADYNWSPPAGLLFAFMSENIKKAKEDGTEQSPVISTPDGHILCDNQHVRIGSELHDALRRLRLTDRQRVIWIDAICINQNDNEERGLQVGIMGEIYRKAEQVLIWLGENYASGRAVQEMLDFVLQLEVIISQIMFTYGQSGRKAIDNALRDAYEYHLISFSLLREILARAWFGRVWVLQEVVNAKKAIVYSGSGHCNWDSILAITRWLSIYDVNGPINIRGTICAIPVIDMIWKIVKIREDSKTQPLPSLIDVLASSRLCKSTYPIDKVYGVLGIISDEDRRRITIDYGRSPEDLFKEISVSELSRSGLDILYHCTKPTKAKYLNCPSWVPDWSQPCYHTPYVRLGLKASASMKSVASFHVDGNTLIARGRIVDCICTIESLRRVPSGSYIQTKQTELTDANKAEAEPRETTDTLEDGDDTSIANISNPPSEPDFGSVAKTKEHILDHTLIPAAFWFPNMISIAFPNGKITPESYEAFWRTCCCNRTTGQIAGSNKPSEGKVPGQTFARYFPAWTKAMKEGMKLRDLEEYHSNVKRFMDSFTKYCDNRRFFRTENGRIGWAPDLTQAGDVVCVLNGASVPLVLRPINGGNLEVVGDAYVHGIMDGEAMKLQLEERDICLV
ncbi:heterokaryon incompatibility protein-domain-containing protein [Tricladium varicosporioides]|nr:heterokaryon incompatibility protein-domain-containing protein [Hymenoscyphus varicosporioides]